MLWRDPFFSKEVVCSSVDLVQVALGFFNNLRWAFSTEKHNKPVTAKSIATTQQKGWQALERGEWNSYNRYELKCFSIAFLFSSAAAAAGCGLGANY